MRSFIAAPLLSLQGYANRMPVSSHTIGAAPPAGGQGGSGGGGGGGGWAWLLTARGLVEARLIAGLLENAGIGPVHLDATDPSPSSWLFLSGNVGALVRVYVPRAQLDGARLALLEQGAPVTPPSRRPPERPRWSVRRIELIILAAVVVVVFGWRLLTASCALC